MDSQSLGNVLAILRMMKNEDNGKSTSQIIREWAGSGASDQAVLKIASYICEEIDLARITVTSSQLSEEAKEGILSVLNRTSSAFSINGMHNSWGNFINDISSFTSSLVILLSALSIDSTQVPEDVKDIIKEIHDLMIEFDDPHIDPLLRDVAKRHLQTLSTLLQHIPIFGMEAAMTAYFEMIMKLRRVDSGTSEEAHKKAEPLWKKVMQWGPRLEALDKQINTGIRLIGHAKKVVGLLDYIPM